MSTCSSREEGHLRRPHLGRCTDVDTMKARALILLLCTAGLLTSVFWPNEVMSPSQVASTEPAASEGELLDLSQFAQVSSEEPVTEEMAVVAPAETSEADVVAVVPQESGSQRESYRGMDHGSLVLQGEILAHRPMEMGPYLDAVELHPGRERYLDACAFLANDQMEASKNSFEGLKAEDPVSSSELAALQLALSTDGEGAGLVTASSGTSSPLVTGLEIAQLRIQLRDALRARDYKTACAALSGLLEAELSAEWQPHLESLTKWAAQLNEAQRFHRWSEKGEWPSLDYVVKAGDSLVAIRKKVIAENPDLNLCTGLIQRANQLRDGNSIHPGQKLRIPLDRVHTLVSLKARFLLYYHDEEVVAAWPVTIGRENRTVPGEYTTGEKQEEPMWFRQGEDPVPFGDPENPLGTRWIAWNGSNGLGFHGTWEPEKIGQAASDGCIRMKNGDVEVLFEVLPRGARIVVLP